MTLSYAHMKSRTIPEDDTVVINSQGDHSSCQLAELRYVLSMVQIYFGTIFPYARCDPILLIVYMPYVDTKL